MNENRNNYAIPLTIITLVGLSISMVAFYEDYQSSLNGYRMLPTRKASLSTIHAIAALPQVGQVIFFFLFGGSVVDNSKKPNYVYFTISLFLFLFDLLTDMYFKASGLDFYVWVIAFFESFIVFTIGSEVLLMTCLVLLGKLLPQAVYQINEFFIKLIVQDV